MEKKLPLVMAIASLFAFTGKSFAQNPGLSARDLFYISIDSPSKPAIYGVDQGAGKASDKLPALLVLRYSVLKFDSSGGAYSEVLPDTVFRANDAVRLRVTSNQNGFLYIVQQGSSGAWRPLFPNPDIDGGNNRINAGESYNVPGNPGENFVVDDHPGEERIFILLARKPVTDLDQLIATLHKANTPATDGFATSGNNPGLRSSLVEQLLRQAQGRDLVFTTIDKPNQEDAVYVAKTTASLQSDDRIVVDLKLNHR